VGGRATLPRYRRPRMRRRGLLGLGIAAVVAGAACGLDGGGLFAGDGLDASVRTDASLLDAAGGQGGDAGMHPESAEDASEEAAATSDAGGDDAADTGSTFPDAGPCDGGLVCNGVCVAGATDCTACSGAPLLCAASGTCGTDCASCPGASIQCFNCDSSRGDPVGTCQPINSSGYCLDENDYPASPSINYGYHCACPSNDAGDCPGATQTCADLGGIFDPGNVCKTCGEASTDGVACKGGGVCNAATFTCK
jgi:hypothetical protein